VAEVFQAALADGIHEEAVCLHVLIALLVGVGACPAVQAGGMRSSSRWVSMSALISILPAFSTARLTLEVYATEMDSGDGDPGRLGARRRRRFGSDVAASIKLNH
jgi:hypothetical protein